MTKHNPLHFPDLLARYFRTCVFKKEKCFIFQQGTYAGGKKTKVLIPSPIRSLQMALLQNFYETTLEALREAKNDRLWFKTNTKLGKLYFDREDYGKLQRILKQLHQSCQVSGIDIAVEATPTLNSDYLSSLLDS